VGAVTCTRNDGEREIQHRYQHAATASWWTERNLIPPTTEAAVKPRKEKVAESPQDYNGKGVLF
jgi:hypothetical protein